MVDVSSTPPHPNSGQHRSQSYAAPQSFGTWEPDPEDMKSDEASLAKLCAVYVSEAEKYDKALVESWKSDMDGMLIFAGLFSASLTAFIIESYKTLNADSGSRTVVLLAQISLQLSAAASGTSTSLPAPDIFVVPTTSLVCNAFWFISLGLSLSCALIATLLEQWARDFLHKADMCSAPVVRARVFSYLYYGLKRFNMHTMVEILPLLLHASLLFFFAGLVAFLIPVNNIMVFIAAAILALAVIVYGGLTLLPLFYLDCPYRTPLSATFWRLLQWSGGQTQASNLQTHSESVVEATLRSATEVSPERASRDCRALIWTMKSLTDDTELEPFVEAIPEMLWGPQGRRCIFDDYIRTLMSHPEVQLIPRIESLLRITDSGLLSTEAATRRRITCLKAIWALCSLSHRSVVIHPCCDLGLLRTIYRTAEGPVKDLASSALALANWAEFCALGPAIDHALNLLQTPHLLQTRTVFGPPTLDPTLLCRQLNGMFSTDLMAEVYGSELLSSLSEPQRLAHALADFNANGPFLILVQWLVGDHDQPYEYERTRATLQYSEQPGSALMAHLLNHAILNLTPPAPELFSKQQPITRADNLVASLGALWRSARPAKFPFGLLAYIHRRSSTDAVMNVVQSCQRRLPVAKAWSMHSRILPPKASPSEHPQKTPAGSHAHLILVGLWHLAFSSPPFTIETAQKFTAKTYESALTAVDEYPADPLHKAAVIAVLKCVVLNSFFKRLSPGPDAVVDLPEYSFFPRITAIHPADLQSTYNTDARTRYELRHFASEDGVLNSSAVLWAQRLEAEVVILAEFLEGFGAHSTTRPRHKFWPQSTLTLRALCTLTKVLPPTFRVHADHQIRLAQSIGQVLQKTEAHTNFMEELLWLVGIRDSSKIPPGDIEEGSLTR
ncbi:hypothetical protein B0H16DRAFT_1902589 [Mycena metata]|uniref:DUF6535 domain-containing protein n=1 Tax=Mycena metata TaxID=1033252 RepID=A0AAD7GQL6_9AGAR|nr:hypothetical protein B0H16DRAFT_1902589 [Mycena metata]